MNRTLIEKQLSLVEKEIQQLQTKLVEHQEKKLLLLQQLQQIPDAPDQSDEKTNRFQTLVKMVANTDAAIHPFLTKEIRPMAAVNPDMEFLKDYPIVPDYDCSSVKKDDDNPLDLTYEEALYLAKLNDIITTEDINPSQNITRRELCNRLFLARLVRKDGQLLDPSVREPVARMYLPVENKPVGRFINNPVFPRLPPLKGQDRLYVKQLSNSEQMRHVSTGYFKGKQNRKSIKKNTKQTRKTRHKRF